MSEVGRRTVSGKTLHRVLSLFSSKTPVYATYEEAQRACRNSYEDAQLARIVAAKTEVFADSLRNSSCLLDLGELRVLMAVVNDERADRPLRVLDLGGAAGYHYLIARQLIAPGRELSWHVVETEPMVQAAQELATPELQFFTSISDAVDAWGAEPDVAFASGVLQCVPDPLALAEELVSTAARTLVITRTALSATDSTQVIVQRSTLSANGPGPLPEGFVDGPAEFPTTFVPLKRFTAILESRYRIIAQLREDPCAYTVEGTCVPMHGFLCRLRSSNGA